MINEHAMISHEALLERGLRDAISVLGDRLLPAEPVQEIISFGRGEDDPNTVTIWLTIDGQLCSIAIEPGRRVAFLEHGPAEGFLGGEGAEE